MSSGKNKQPQRSRSIRYRNNPKPPKVFIDPEAYEDMFAIVLSVNTEVAWFAQVVPHASIEDAVVIQKVVVPHQQATSATVEIEPDDLFKLADEYLADHGADEYNRLRCWGHSHHSMGVSPSSQDQSMLDKMMDTNGADFFVAIRMNHAGEIEVDYATRDVTFEAVDYYIGRLDDDVFAYWAGVVKERLRPITYTSKATPHKYQPKTYPGYPYPGQSQHKVENGRIVYEYDDDWRMPADWPATPVATTKDETFGPEKFDVEEVKDVLANLLTSGEEDPLLPIVGMEEMVNIIKDELAESLADVLDLPARLFSSLPAGLKPLVADEAEKRANAAMESSDFFRSGQEEAVDYGA